MHTPIQDSEKAIAFAEAELGPESAAFLRDARVRVLVLARLRAGAELPDAVLAEVHREAAGNRSLANEFLGYFLRSAHLRGRRSLRMGLRRFLDSWDLAQSGLGDVWSDLASLRFDDRASFLALLAQRMRWKSSRLGERTSRLEEIDEPSTPDPADDGSNHSEPERRAIESEESGLLALAVLKLSARDQALVRSYLRGAPIEAVMREHGLGYEAARRARLRAVNRAREAVLSHLNTTPPDASE